MTSTARLLSRAALALLFGWGASIAWPCSVSRVIDPPYGLDTYGFYGEVVGHVSMRITGCELLAEPRGCEPSWGLRVRILEPLNVPARDLTEVEYYAFGTRSDCRALPMPHEQVLRQYPVGTRIGLAARLFTWDEPRPPRIRLTSLRPIIGEAIFVVPPDIDLRKLATTPFDYPSAMRGRELTMPAEDRARVDFELWRDTLRLLQSKSEREALAILQRMASVNSMGILAEDQYYSAIEQLVDQFLPNPALRTELLRAKTAQ